MHDGSEVATNLAVRLRLVLDLRRWSPVQAIINQSADPDDLLDLIEAVLQVSTKWGEPGGDRADLELLLRLGGSLYTVNDAGELVERISPEAQASMDAASAIEDDASLHLGVAWGKAYGRNPDPSDAWDHAIKALEAVLGPVVEPLNTRRTLGSIIAVLRNDEGGKLATAFQATAEDRGTAKLANTLTLVWPNPDRHESPGGREPSLAEARAVVGLTVALIQCDRENYLVSRGLSPEDR